TVIRLLLGLVYATSGEIEVFGRPVPRRVAEVLPSIGALVEGPAAYPHLSGRTNLRLIDTAGPRHIGIAGPRHVGIAGPRHIDIAGPRPVGIAGPRHIDIAAPRHVGIAGPRLTDAGGPRQVGTTGFWPPAGSGRRDRRRRIEEALERVGLAGI